MAIFERDISQTLVFTGTYNHNQKIMNVTQSLTFAQMDSARDNHESLFERLGFTQIVGVGISGRRNLTQTLTFTQHAARNQTGDVHQNLAFTESATPGNKWPAVTDVLTFVQTATGVAATAGRNTLVFTETIGLQAIRSLVVNQSLQFGNFGVGYKLDVGFISTPPPVTVVNDTGTYVITPTRTVTPAPTIQFAIGSNVITLKRPDFSNGDALNLRRIQRETRNGDLIIYRDPSWSATQALTMEFTYIDEVKARAFQDFVRSCLGLLVLFTDHEGHVWTGVFNSPELEIKTTGRFNNSFSIVFEVIFA